MKILIWVFVAVFLIVGSLWLYSGSLIQTSIFLVFRPSISNFDPTPNTTVTHFADTEFKWNPNNNRHTFLGHQLCLRDASNFRLNPYCLGPTTNNYYQYISAEEWIPMMMDFYGCVPNSAKLKWYVKSEYKRFFGSDSFFVYSSPWRINLDLEEYRGNEPQCTDNQISE